MTTTKEDITQRELLIRIDERQKQMSLDIKILKDNLEKRVPLDNDYLDICKKVNNLWDWKNKTMGYAAGAGAIASIVFNLFQRYAFN